MKPTRLASLFLCSIACTFLPGVAAASSPTPIHVVVPFVPGASADVLMRLVTNKVTQQNSQQQVMVENKPGGSGIIGAEYVKNAGTHSQVLFQSSIGTHGVNPPLYGAKLPYDAVQDFKPVGMLWRFPSVLAVSSQSPATDLPSLLKLADRPNGLTYGSPGVGTGGHLLGAMFSKAINKPMTHVPYKGAAAAMVDLAANRIDVVFASYSSVRTLVEEGRLRVLAVAGERRLDLIPTVPTLGELKIDGVIVDNWFGLSAPKSTSDEAVQRLSTLFAAAMKDPEIVKKLKDEGVEAVGGTPADYGAFIRSEIDRLGQVVREFGISAE